MKLKQVIKSAVKAKATAAKAKAKAMMNADGEMPTLADGTTTASGFTALYFTEVGINTFLVKGEQLKQITQ